MLEAFKGGIEIRLKKVVKFDTVFPSLQDDAGLALLPAGHRLAPRRKARPRRGRLVAGEAATAADDFPDDEPRVHLGREERGSAHLRRGEGVRERSDEKKTRRGAK